VVQIQPLENKVPLLTTEEIGVILGMKHAFLLKPKAMILKAATHPKVLYPRSDT
jgi:hypothetical protein